MPQEVKNFDQFLRSELNEAQLNAVKHHAGALQVIAGAGSGKTRVITARIAFLILHENVDPSKVVALTFTNKAAKEMKNRLANFLGPTVKLPFVGTFHSFCLMLLRTTPTLSNAAGYSILDADDQLELIKKILKQEGAEKQFSPATVAHQISNAKNRLRLQKEQNEFTQPVLEEIMSIYETTKVAAKLLDFDDLLLEGLKLFEKNENFRKQFQEKISHILVDEYQDTNLVQHELLKKMALDKQNKLALKSICIVGDEDQSIYSWRGAAPTNMLLFAKEFPHVLAIKIEQNYRSVQPILETANAVISHNKMRNPKKLWSSRAAQDRILSLTCRSEYQEADAVALLAGQLSRRKILQNSAILYRTHFQSRVLEESLARTGIPYKIVGGLHFYARKEIKDILAYLRLVVNPYDRISLMRIINVPSRGLGEKVEETIAQLWQKNPFFNYNEILTNLITDAEITKKKREEIEKFIAIFKDLDSNHPPAEVARTILERSNYFEYLRASYDEDEGTTKQENIREFIQSMLQAANNEPDKKITLALFLEELALLQEKIESAASGAAHIPMMTIHAAKGLEFDTVILVGLEEGLFPSIRSLNSYEALEEERRLFYVGITRAKERLVFCGALFRTTYGQLAAAANSRFLDEAPKAYIRHLDVSAHNVALLEKEFATWLASRSEKQIAKAAKVEKPQTQKGEVRAANAASPWKKNQIVTHATFGTGVILEVEKKGEQECYITALFRGGKKKLSSKFLEKA